jgi:hypothetical protein
MITEQEAMKTLYAVAQGPYVEPASYTCTKEFTPTFIKLVGPRGFEPLTYGFEDRYDIHFTKDPWSRIGGSNS